MPPRAVIFDLWGTLIPFDYERWQPVMTAIAEVLGVPPEDFEREWRRDYERRLVSDLRASFERVSRLLGVTRADAVEDDLRLRVEAHREMFVPREDAVTTLRVLHDRGYSTGLITNCSSEDPELLLESPLAGLFDVEVFSCSAGLRKPQRAIYELATTRLGLEPRLCLYVGDGDDHELDGACDFGMSAVLLRPGDTRPPDGWQGAEITSLAQVLKLVP
ncbi:MAG: HAD family hydrolase [Gaiellaceae bacterium]|jgi:putative hydrolase of the HAD superfamily